MLKGLNVNTLRRLYKKDEAKNTNKNKHLIHLEEIKMSRSDVIELK